MINEFLALLPNLAISILVFFIFFFAGRAVKRIVRRLNEKN
ncbi:hypothetical protein ACE1CI_18240 [Aerosakkonemataceae cyanobacterium BLCC-F50]|uniref:Photosystem II protein M n=1 Tax=Floridaenema flaviceps BLCC-F50 TaxID=3153642 RepID=A0ABV4XTT7_9CYAN